MATDRRPLFMRDNYCKFRWQYRAWNSGVRWLYVVCTATLAWWLLWHCAGVCVPMMDFQAAVLPVPSDC